MEMRHLEKEELFIGAWVNVPDTDKPSCVIAIDFNGKLKEYPSKGGIVLVRHGVASKEGMYAELFCAEPRKFPSAAGAGSSRLCPLSLFKKQACTHLEDECTH